MAKVKVIEHSNNPYPDEFDQMEPGDYAIANYEGKDVVVIKCYHGDFQMLGSNDAWNENSKISCKILPKGTVIEITV
jgi:hypothetical protein